MKMKAVVSHGAKDFRPKFVERPIPQEGEVLIRIEATGICAGDRLTWSGNAPWGPPHEGLITGHEYVGVVEAFGDKAEESTKLAIGDRVTAEIQVPCNKCYYCNVGLKHLCEDESGLLMGSWAEYMILPKGAIIHKVPKTIDKLEAALIEPLTCSAHSIELARISMKDVVVISGMGAIGLGAVQFAKLRTPYKLICLDINDDMLEKARALGAEYTFNPLKDEVKKEIDKITDGIGADIFIETSGNTVSLSTGFEVLRKRGRLVAYGVYSKKAELDFNYVSQHKELEIIGGHLSPGCYPFVIKALTKGLVDAKALITDVYSFDDFEKAIYAKENNPLSIKTVLIPMLDGGDSK